MACEAAKYEEGIAFKNISHFELKHILDCGQCFRWNENEDGSYTGTAFNKTIRVIKEGKEIYLKGAKIEDEKLWLHYFDIERDYGKIINELSNDEVLKEAIKHGEGIRILNQEPFETLISFIISANNRIPMIKRAVYNISKRFGNKMSFEGKEYYSFPKPSVLSQASVEDLMECGCGFRAPYILETSKEIANGNANLEYIMSLDTDCAQKELIKLKGIGPKVADCIMLYSMGKNDAFPVDVWVKRVMQYFYLAPDVSLKKIRDFGRERFGHLAGFAQQYLFYYARDLKGKKGLEK